MKESQTQVFEQVHGDWGEYKRRNPEIAKPFDEGAHEVYKDGEITGKHKRLMALCAALVSGCRGCILFQLREALEMGATVEEVFEVVGVAVSLGGTMASAEASRVMGYLDEQGLLP